MLKIRQAVFALSILCAFFIVNDPSFADPNTEHEETNAKLRAQILFSKGVAEKNLGRNEEATKYFDKAIELNPLVSYLHARGLIKIKQKKYREALEDFNRVIELDKDKEDFETDAASNALTMRAFAKEGLGQDKEAFIDLNKAIDMYPENAVAFNNRGLLKAKFGLHDEAIKDYDRALQLDPANTDFINNRRASEKALRR